MKITRHTDMIVNGRPFQSWYESADGDHVSLPLDASAVTDAVVERVATAIKAEYTDIVLQNREDTPMSTLLARAAIAALAQALGEEQ